MKRSDDYMNYYDNVVKIENKNKVPDFHIDIPDINFSEDNLTVVKYGLFKEYYGKVTNIEIVNTLRGYTVVVEGWYDSILGRKYFSKVEEDCFAGGDSYNAYFKNEAEAFDRKQKVLNRKFFVL